MNTTTFSNTYWNNVKPKLIKMYPVLTDLDLVYKPGELREMMHHIEIKIHKTDKELRDLLDQIH